MKKEFSKYTEHGKVEIFGYEQDGNIVIKVSDTGIGVVPEHLMAIFEPFKQLENSIGGTGLGLSVTKELVNIQGGSITVNSEVGKGTTFSIVFPKATQKSNERQI